MVKDLSWVYKELLIELSPSRTKWKAYNDKKEVIASGRSFNEKKLTKEDVENALVEISHARLYQPVIS